MNDHDDDDDKNDNGVIILTAKFIIVAIYFFEVGALYFAAFLVRYKSMISKYVLGPRWRIAP